MRIAVSNSSPLINLSIINRFHLLYSFDSIHIPPAVWNEVVVSGEGLPGCDEVRNGVKRGKIIVTPLSDPESVEKFRRVLHLGEAEAIILGIQIRPNVIILDEHAARDEAVHLGLDVVGVIGILANAKKMGLILSLKEELDNLRSAAGFRIHPSLYSYILKQIGEE